MKRSLAWTPSVFIFTSLLVFSSISLADVDTWTRKADMPIARWALATSVVNGKIYAIGGNNGPTVVEEYDPATDKWTKKADMPTARSDFSTSTVNGKIYAIGGLNPQGAILSTVEEYDPTTDTWTKKADMPTARWALATSTVNGKIYAIGGGRFGTPFSIVEEYDPLTDTWTRKADMPTPSGFLSTSAVNGKIYAIGGQTSLSTFLGQTFGLSLSTVQEYDPITDRWTKKADMPTARVALATSVVNGKIYAIGGLGVGTGPPLSTVEEYDPVADTWTKKADMPIARAWLSTSALNGKIYAIGGSAAVGAIIRGPLRGPQPIVEEYNIVGIRVTRISPQEGRVTGGESLAIFGSGFPSGASITIGGKSVTEIKVTDTLITGITPPGTEGEADILITLPGFSDIIFAGKFIYRPLSNVVVTAMTPTNGKQAGGDRGNITGSGFLQGATVIIGETSATDVVVTPTLILFTILPGTEGAKDVVVINPDGQKSTLLKGYTYNPFPRIEKLEPEGGPLVGGTQLSISGNNFMQGVVVEIGGERVSRLDFFSPTELRLQTPRNTAGPKDVRIINPDGQEAVLKEGFSYNSAPIISSIEPNAGGVEGGTQITISGSGFLSIITRKGLSIADVFIGGVEASLVLVVSPTKIMAKTPPATAGMKDIVVINPDGQEARLKDAFTYNLAPAIKSIQPNNGKLAGGTKIIIQGSKFLPGAEVFIGDVDEGGFVAASSPQVESDTIITAITPMVFGEPGPKDVMVLNPDNQKIVLRGGFRYNPMPTIRDISPNYGSASGGTKVIIRGTGFLQGARVIIGKRPATTEFKDDETIEAVTPANPKGRLDVKVINPDTQEAVIQRAFISVGELAYNYPNPFRASQGTTFRYVPGPNESVESIVVRIFNLAGVPIGVVGAEGGNEVQWQDSKVHVGLYVYLMEVKLTNGQVKRFKRMLEVYK